MSTFYNKKGKEEKFGQFIRLVIGLPFLKIDDLQTGVNNLENVVKKIATKKCRNWMNSYCNIYVNTLSYDITKYIYLKILILLYIFDEVIRTDLLELRWQCDKIFIFVWWNQILQFKFTTTLYLVENLNDLYLRV